METFKTAVDCLTALGGLATAVSIFILALTLKEQRAATRIQTEAAEAARKAAEAQIAQVNAQLVANRTQLAMVEGTRQSVEAQLKLVELQKDEESLEYKWRQKNKTIDLLREWNVTVIHFRDSIVALGADLYGKPSKDEYIKAISEEEARLLWDNIPNYPNSPLPVEEDKIRTWQRRELNGNLIRLLNYFEYMSACYLSGVTDKEMTIASFQPTMTRWYRALSKYIAYVDSTRRSQTWPPFVQLMAEWDTKSARDDRFERP